MAIEHIYDIDKMAKKIASIKQAAMELKKLAGDVQAVERNIDRILASIKMLEINISDIASIKSKS